jgi:hypothetical protein
MRLIEVLLHTWDVEVMSSPAATVPAAGVAEVVELFPATARRRGRVDGVERHVLLRTTDPDGSYVLETGPDEVTLTPKDAGPGARELTGDALLRLMYGRLDDELAPVFPRA